MKRQLTWLAASVAALGAGAAGAQIYTSNPGYGYGYGYGNDGYGQAQTVRCESVGSRQQRCRIAGSGEVHIARQLSRQPCVRGRNWDASRYEIRVTDGCRADFVVGNSYNTGYGHGHPDDRYGHGYGQGYGHGYGQGQVVRCESRSYGRTYCGDAYGQYAMVGYRNSSCVANRTYGQDQRGLWVSGNCSAQFQRTDGYGDRYGQYDRQDSYLRTVRCESYSSSRTYCGDPGARYTLRGYPDRDCIQGRTFGADSRGLWVSHGCNAEFTREPLYGQSRHGDNRYYSSDTYRADPYYQRDY